MSIPTETLTFLILWAGEYEAVLVGLGPMNFFCYHSFVQTGFVFNLYQPSVQDKENFEKIVEQSYYPLLKSIKNIKNIRVTLNIPLSTSYLLKERGYDDLFKVIRELTESEKVELTSCGAYYPLLTKLPNKLIEKQIILNEFGLGYYFGKSKGFEGEDAILIKNVSGFYAPELCINDKVLDVIESLNYSWTLADESSLLNTGVGASLVALPEKNLKLVIPNKELSNLISAKRDTEIADVMSVFSSLFEKQNEVILAFDADVFGYKYKEGIFLLESVIESLKKFGVGITTVSDISSKSYEEAVPGIHESVFNYSCAEQEVFWKLYNKLLAMADPAEGVSTPKELNFAIDTMPVWDPAFVSKVKDADLGGKLLQSNLYMQCMSLNQFVYACSESESELKDRYLEMYKELGLDV